MWKVFRIGTVRYNWPMSAHASQAFSIAHCTDSEDLLKMSHMLTVTYIHTVIIIYIHSYMLAEGHTPPRPRLGLSRQKITVMRCNYQKQNH